MTKNLGERTRFGWRGVPLLIALLVGSIAMAQNREANVIKSIKTVRSGVEIELRSTAPFIQSDLPVLRIGDQEFTLSRYPDSGDPKTLIFMLTSDEFNKTASGDQVIFQYGRGEHNAKRDFGQLDKSKRDKRSKRSK